MKVSQFFLTMALSLTCYCLSGQIGISARYQMNSTENWNTSYDAVSTNNGKVLNSGLELGLSYWFRLKNKRIEFLPEVSYAVASDGGLQTATSTVDHRRQSLSLSFNTMIYPFDFHSDCSSCPTFSKEGNTITKGFYWILSPGVSMHNFSGTYLPLISSAATEISQDSQINFRLGLGAGLDFGVTNLLTLSPFVMYSLNPGIDYDSLNTSLGVTTVETCLLKQVHLGMRAILRFDKNKW